MNHPSAIALSTLAGVMVCWLVFAGVFLFRKRPPKSPDATRDSRATLGIILQMAGYFLVWFQPPHSDFLAPLSILYGIPGTVFAVVTVAVAGASVWLVAASVRTLGKEWAVRARLVEDHRLITVGPYAHIRNPIYTGMLGMLVATGFAMRHWIALIAGTVVFMAGLVIRVRVEERLLRKRFGQQFDEYANRVSAVLPGIY